MKKDGGCWEVYGNMPDGKRVEAYFHPETGEVLIISQRGTILYQAEKLTKGPKTCRASPPRPQPGSRPLPQRCGPLR